MVSPQCSIQTPPKQFAFFFSFFQQFGLKCRWNDQVVKLETFNESNKSPSGKISLTLTKVKTLQLLFSKLETFYPSIYLHSVVGASDSAEYGQPLYDSCKNVLYIKCKVRTVKDLSIILIKITFFVYFTYP